MRQIDLCADGVGEVGNDKDVLDVVVEVALDIGNIDLWCEGEGIHEELTESVVWLALFVQNVGDVLGDALEEVQGVLNGALEGLNIGNDWCGAGLGVLGSRNELETGLLSLVVLDLVWDWNEQAGLCGALSVDTDWGGNVGLRDDLLAGLGGNGQVNSWVWEGSSLRAGEEVLDKGGEVVQLEAGGVPSEKDFAWVGLQLERKHVLLVLDIDLDLVLSLGVVDGEAVADLDLHSILRAGTKEGSDDAVGRWVATGGMVEDGEDDLSKFCQPFALTI